MLYPTAMILADKATRRHVLSARPDAPVSPDRPPERHSGAARRLAVAALRRLADTLEPAPRGSWSRPAA
ncbi:hypothetical protein [Actinoplanes sp. M2I2]|uniref:hypothetical protein n=1 Tax=Actinoplanes sp. M2I2 TaxID=1734444 RepID=UPI00202285FF|nr:hypothetical protein [Actinoplanes sp. M2I2]